MIQRGGQLVIRMLADVKQGTIGPLIKAAIAPGSVVDTDEYDIYARLGQWGDTHHTVCHAAGEFARDDDGDRICEVHVNTPEGFWSLLRSWLRPHRGHLAGEAAAVPGVLRVRAQRPAAGQGAAGVVDRAPRSTPESRMSLRRYSTWDVRKVGRNGLRTSDSGAISTHRFC
jgi:hypothetical protein